MAAVRMAHLNRVQRRLNLSSTSSIHSAAAARAYSKAGNSKTLPANGGIIIPAVKAAKTVVAAAQTSIHFVSALPAHKNA